MVPNAEFTDRLKPGFRLKFKTCLSLLSLSEYYKVISVVSRLKLRKFVFGFLTIIYLCKHSFRKGSIKFCCPFYSCGMLEFSFIFANDLWIGGTVSSRSEEKPLISLWTEIIASAKRMLSNFFSKIEYFLLL